MKTIKRTKITVETREILIVAGAMVEGRCAQCGGQIEMIKLEDGAARADREVSRADQSRLIEPGDGLRFICLNSLLE